MPKRSWKSIFETDAVVRTAGVVIAVSLIWQTVGVVEKNYNLQKQVDRLEDEIAILELRNQRLGYDIEYFKTDEFLELAARSKFNKVAPGERMVVLPDKDYPEPVLPGQEQPSEPKPQYQENLDQWLYFLFGREPS